MLLAINSQVVYWYITIESVHNLFTSFDRYVTAHCCIKPCDFNITVTDVIMNIQLSRLILYGNKSGKNKLH